MKLSFTTKSMAAGIVLLFASNVSADVITDWSFDLNSGFTSWTDTDGNSGDRTSNGSEITASGDVNIVPTSGFSDDGYSTLSWGTPRTSDGQSNLEVNNPIIADRALTLGDAGGNTWSSAITDGTLLTHNNWVIGADSANEDTLAYLQTATLTDYFQLKSIGHDQTPRIDPFNITFTETRNIENCNFPSASNCDDIFVITNPDALTQSFIIDDYSYTLSIFAIGVGPLDAATCLKAGSSAGCFGLTTPENQSSPVQFKLLLTARNVPEPASLALLGLGLVGFGFGRRKMKA